MHSGISGFSTCFEQRLLWHHTPPARPGKRNGRRGVSSVSLGLAWAWLMGWEAGACLAPPWVPVPGLPQNSSS